MSFWNYLIWLFYEALLAWLAFGEKYLDGLNVLQHAFALSSLAAGHISMHTLVIHWLKVQVNQLRIPSKCYRVSYLVTYS